MYNILKTETEWWVSSCKTFLLWALDRFYYRQPHPQTHRVHSQKWSRLQFDSVSNWKLCKESLQLHHVLRNMVNWAKCGMAVEHTILLVILLWPNHWLDQSKIQSKPKWSKNQTLSSWDWAIRKSWRMKFKMVRIIQSKVRSFLYFCHQFNVPFVFDWLPNPSLGKVLTNLRMNNTFWFGKAWWPNHCIACHQSVANSNRYWLNGIRNCY